MFSIVFAFMISYCANNAFWDDSPNASDNNTIANLFGLGNAATPFGLKAMKSLQELNTKKEQASRSMITFTTINTSGVTIVPTTIIALRILYKSISPTATVISTLISTLLATIAGLTIDRFMQRRYHE